jgi:excisionase family DNA binding protein
MEKLLLRPDEAATSLGVGRSRIYQLLADGVIPAIRVGRSVRVPAHALRAWIADRQRVARPSRPTPLAEPPRDPDDT